LRKKAKGRNLKSLFPAFLFAFVVLPQNGQDEPESAATSRNETDHGQARIA
jgi:hypothetical protein